MESNKIRQAFLDFFQSKQHTIVPSAPMVVKGDPTLMFTNAGMNQFKDIFLGNTPRQFPRAADTQKCLRVSGKHNDLEEVGHDTYHHTMFEMLGNWSFGDYFKKEAIEWAWELLTEVYSLDKSRMYATVFEGSEEDGVPFDQEAYDYWKQYLPEDHIIRGNKHDNFWEMGETGPCGPCSEIHIDLRDAEEIAAKPGRDMVNMGHHLVIEIWNLVFMQFNRKANGELEPLPAKHVDTGMGFERLCMAMQGKKSNYDTDVFQPTIARIAAMAGKKYGEDEKADIAMRVIADHLRTISFSIADGQLPSNVKAGYVIRRILRRAVRYGYTFLEQREAFMYKLVPQLIADMGEAYPELVKQEGQITPVIKSEEESFLRTLDKGITLLDKLMKEAKGKEISGVDVFTLKDTYGFPLDLTQLILSENGFTTNEEEYNKALEHQKEMGRQANKQELGDWNIIREGDTEFVGYDELTCETQVLRYRRVEQKGKALYQVVLSKTPFYAEMGGQVGDSGTLGNIRIIDTKRENNLSVHLCAELPAEIEGTLVATVDTARRQAIACNHTATHIVHYALRQVLGEHVEQKGSYVSPDSLRFDFSHFQKVLAEELRQVEILANEMIRQDWALEESRNTPIAKAKEMGAMALFGEKYGDEVRVIKYGPSAELCGGCHVASTGKIGAVRIVMETSVAAGIRRIEAVTAAKADELYYKQVDTLNNLRALFNNAPDLAGAIRKAIDENAGLKKQIETFMAEKVERYCDELIAKAEDYNGIQLVRLTGNVDPTLLRNMPLIIKNKIAGKHFALVAATEWEGKPMIAVVLSPSMVEAGKNAGQMIKSAAKNIQGGGGGQPWMATAGGRNAEGLAAAMDEMLAALV